MIFMEDIKRIQDNDPSLKDLSLNAKNLDMEKISVLASALTRNSNLEVLDFSNNLIGPQGVQILAKSLEDQSSKFSLVILYGFLSALGFPYIEVFAGIILLS